MIPPRPSDDPLASPLKATLVFGSVFLIAFLVNLACALAVGIHGSTRGADRPGPGAVAMLLGWLGFALSSGYAVAFVRRRTDSIGRKNLATGLVVGACYALACMVTLGATLRFGGGAIVLVLGVWLGVTYALTSGLNEVTRR